MAAPAPPSNITTTVNANDKIEVSWDFDPTWFGFTGDDGTLGGFNDGRWYSSKSVDHFEIQFSRDGIGYKDPSGGPTSVSHDGSTSYTATYGPANDEPYGTQVGIDSMFKFRIRAVNSDGASNWESGGTVYTQAIPPHNPSVSRPGPNQVEIDISTKSNIASGIVIEAREDTGSGYNGWSWFDTTNEGELPKTYETGVEYNAGWAMKEDARYQFRAYHHVSPNRDMDSTETILDYGNQGNVYFEDGFESGDLSAWDASPGFNVDSNEHPDTGISGADEGTYYASGYNDIDNDSEYLQKDLGNLSGQTGVIVKLAMAVGSMDNSTEWTVIDWYDGSSWQELTAHGHEYNEQGWVEISVTVPDNYLSTDNRIRLGGRGGLGGGDQHAFDRVVVSDILHEYTRPAAPSSPSLDGSIEGEITANWTDNASFNHDQYVEFRKSSGSSFQYVFNHQDTDNPGPDVEQLTIKSLDDGEKYDVKIQSKVIQDRHGEGYTGQWRIDSPVSSAKTILPIPSSPSATTASDSSISLDWVDEANNEDGYRVYYREVGASSWNQYSSPSANTELETVNSLNQDTEYEFKVETYTEHTSSESPVTTATTYLNESRSTSSHSSPGESHSIRVTDIFESVHSHATTGDSTSKRVVSLLEGVTSSSTAIRSQNSILIALNSSVKSSSASASSSATRVADVDVATASHAASAGSSSLRVVDILAGTLSLSGPAGSSSERGSLNFEGRESEHSISSDFFSSAIRVVALDEEVLSSASSGVSSSERGGISYEGRESDYSFLDKVQSSAIRIVDLKESVSSHAKSSESFVYNDRTSLELLDHDITWNDGEAAWYTDWFQEKKITGSEDQLAIRSLVVEDSKEPAATVVVQYDSDGDGEIDEESEPIRLGRNQTVADIVGISIDEDGFYRLRISQYSGYNSLYAIDTGIVN